ncbi:MAG: SLATT domain-containing protein [Pseudomonadota bacterium]
MNKPILTAEQPVSKAKDEIIKEAQRIEESALYSSKGHFAASHFWTNFHLCVGIPMVVLAAIAGSSFISNNNRLGGVFSIIIAILSAVMTFLNPNERASTHLNAGNNYDALQNDVRLFRTVECWQGNTEQILSERLKSLSNQKNHLNQGSPQIPWWAYQIAKRGIQAGEGSYSIDKSNKAFDQISIPEKSQYSERAIASPESKGSDNNA